MASMFWENVFNRLGKLNKSQKWLADASKVGKTVINSGIARKSSPTVDHAIEIAKVFSVTIEELVDGEAGGEYVRQVVRPKLPPQIVDIVTGLIELDNSQLDIIRGAMRPMLEAKKGKEADATGTNTLIG
jgi:DNA-binding XRE family transcriptional regulator